MYQTGLSLIMLLKLTQDCFMVNKNEKILTVQAMAIKKNLVISVIKISSYRGGVLLISPNDLLFRLLVCNTHVFFLWGRIMKLSVLNTPGAKYFMKLINYVFSFQSIVFSKLHWKVY